MKAPYGKMRMSVLAAAVQGAMLAMCSMPVYAADPDVADLTTPDNFVEIGAANLSHDSNKFGEYSGMNDNGAYAIGNFSVKGGDGYGPGDGITRWSVTGSNLGLDSRELNGSFSKQGQWNMGIGYDELQHNTTDGYQTPYSGSMGGNNFTLPTGFGTVPGASSLNLTPTQLSAFHTKDVNNTRKNTSFTAGYFFSPDWKATLDYNHLKQDGAKLMAFSSDGSLGGGVSAERISILPNPTNYTTDTVNLAVDWKGDKGHLTIGYFGSFFNNHDDRVTWTTWGGANRTDTMSVAPDNELSQFNLLGGYKFSPATKLTGGFSYGRNTQNDNYVASPASLVSIPKASLHGEVITTHADVKLVDQTTKDLKLSGGVTYNKRDNQTNSGTYEFRHIGNGLVEFPNAPISYDKTQYELAADYKLGKNNKIRIAYNHDEMNRYCDQYANSVNFPAGTKCLVDTDTKEDRLSLLYKMQAAEGINLRTEYVYSGRNTNYNTLAQVPMESQRGNILPSGALSGPPADGLNGGDYLGFHPLYDASRDQNMIKLGVNWEVNDKLSLSTSGRYADDNYTEGTFGPQNGKSWNLNLDGSYNYADDGMVFGYISQDYRDRNIDHNNHSNATSNAYRWSDKLKDEGITYGLGFKQAGLLGGNLDIKGDLTYSDAKTKSSSDLYYTYPGGTTTAITCAGPTQLTCGSAPDVKNKMTQFKLSGTYKVDKQSKIAVGYIYQKLETTDYYYNGYQYGFAPTSVLPTNQNSGDYSVNVVAVSYIYSFK